MSARHACDGCAVRKIKCNGRLPCHACILASLECTRLRKRGKSGPKGPRQRTKNVISKTQQEYQQRQSYPDPRLTVNLGLRSPPPTGHPAPPPFSSLPERQTFESFPDVWSGSIPLSSLGVYIDIYYYKLYPVWPVIRRDALLARLQNLEDVEAYALATSICAATIAQLKLPVERADEAGCLSVHHSTMAVEAERARMSIDYSEKPTLEILLTSFFLHVFYANTGKYHKSTLLLRESITFAHMLGLHKESHYVGLSDSDVQDRLRVAWLLFITERAHSIQYELPMTLNLSSGLPQLESHEQPFLFSAFFSLCRLFHTFNNALPDGRATTSTREDFSAVHAQLRQLPPLPRYINELQRADVSVTQQWMRILLWKFAMPYVTLTMDSADQNFSFSFPTTIAKELLSNIRATSMDTLEAHGPGMEMKLYEVANSLADVITCVPSLAQVGSLEIGPRDILSQLANSISSFRGGNPVLLSLLQQKMMDCGLGISQPGRIIEVADDTIDNHLHQSSSSNDTARQEPGGSDWFGPAEEYSDVSERTRGSSNFGSVYEFQNQTPQAPESAHHTKPLYNRDPGPSQSMEWAGEGIDDDILLKDFLRQYQIVFENSHLE